MVLADLSFFLKRDSHRGELEGLLQASSNKTRQRLFIALPRFLLDVRHQALHSIHFFLRRLLQPPSQQPLQRLEENHQQKQENGGGRLRRNLRRQPTAEPPHQAQIQQRQKGSRHCIHEILLPPDLQKIEPMHQVDQHRRRQNRQQRQNRAYPLRQVTRQRPAQHVQLHHQRRADGKHSRQQAVKERLRAIRRPQMKTDFPRRADQHCQRQPDSIAASQRVPRNQKIKSGRIREHWIHMQSEIKHRSVGREQHTPLKHPAPKHPARVCVFEVQMNQQRRQKAESGAEQRLGERCQQRRRRKVVDLRIQCEQRAGIKEEQGQRKKEKHALEVALPPVPKNHHHPEKLQQGSGREPDQSQINKRR